MGRELGDTKHWNSNGFKLLMQTRLARLELEFFLPIHKHPGISPT
jgi:hypothetical protein